MNFYFYYFLIPRLTGSFIVYDLYMSCVSVSILCVISSNFLLIFFKWMFPSPLKHIHDGCLKYFSIKFNIWKYSGIVTID